MSSHDWYAHLGGIRIVSHLSVFVMLIFLATTLSSCVPQGVVTFPEETQTTTTTTTSAATETSVSTMPDDGILVVTRYPDEAIRYLGMFFYSRLTGVFPPDSEDRIGLDVNLAELDQFSGVFPMDILQLPSGEGGEDQLRVMIASDVIPDVYTTRSAPVAASESIAADLSDAVAMDSRFAPGAVYPAALEGVKWQGRVYGVPDFLTVPVLYADRQLADQYDMNLPHTSGWNADQFTAEMEKVFTVSEADVPLSEDRALESAVELLALVPPQLDRSLGWASWNGQRFTFTDEVFGAAADWVHMLAENGWTADRVGQGEDSDVPGNAYSGRSILQFGTSDDPYLDREPVRIPYMDVERSAAHVHAFCVHPKASDNKTIVDFAVFLGMDPDARLLLSRFYSAVGELPVLPDPDVWAAILNDSASAAFYLPFRTLLQQAYPDDGNLPEADPEFMEQYQKEVRAFLAGEQTRAQLAQHLTDAVR